jgi:hypothetical protein
MDYLSEFLNGLFIGLIAGIFPLWWWFSADIMYFSVTLKKTTPKWMGAVAHHHPFLIYFYENLYYKPFYQITLRILTIVYIVCFIIFSLCFPIKGAPYIINFLNKAGFDLGLLLVWLLPSFFVRRYLKRRTIVNIDKTVNKPNIKSIVQTPQNPPPFGRLGFILSFLGLLLLMTWLVNLNIIILLVSGVVFLSSGLFLIKFKPRHKNS